MQSNNVSGTKGEIEVAKELIHSNIMTEIEIRRRREHKQVGNIDWDTALDI